MTAAADPPATMQLRLYLVRGAPNSIAARANLASILSTLAPDDYSLEIVDCTVEPERALHDGVLVTPTLVKIAPEPLQTIIGALTDREAVIATLGIPATVEAARA